MRKIWFVSHYSMPPKYEMRIKTQMYASILKSRGYETKIFCASTIHNTNINLIETKEKFIKKNYDGIDFVHVKCRNYSGNGVKRILNMVDFEKGFYKVAKQFEKPDCIVADVNCVNYYWIYKYCKKNNIKFYIDMRDLWPLSIVEYAGYSPKNPIIKYLYYREKIMYKRCSGVIFSMPGGKDYIADKKWEKYLPNNKIFYINNGVDLEAFIKQKQENIFIDEDLDSKDFKVIYTGSIREANNIESIYKTAKLFQDKNANDIKFILYGDGSDKEKFANLAIKEGLKNVIFKGQIEKKYIPYILSKSDLLILNYKKASTLKYGGSQNKLFEYMASGKPVLITMKMNYNDVEEYNCGLCLDEPNEYDIYEAILKLKEMGKIEYDKMCSNAYERAKEYDFNKLTDKLENILRGNIHEN